MLQRPAQASVSSSTCRYHVLRYRRRMRQDDFRKQYDLQFRWEEDRLVYRHKRRGVPIEVLPAERERALERFERLYNRVVIWWSGTTMFLIGGFVAIMPESFRSAPYLIAIMGASGVSLGLLSQWAWNEPTRHWRSRRPIGEPLGRPGALVMMTEKLKWREVAVGIIGPPLIALPLVGSPRSDIWPPSSLFQWSVLALIAGVFMLGLLIGLIKFALHERDRLRARRRQNLDDARRLFDERA